MLVEVVDVFNVDNVDKPVDDEKVAVVLAVEVLVEVDVDVEVLVRDVVLVLVEVLVEVDVDVDELDDVLVTALPQSIPPNPTPQLQLNALFSDCAFGHVTATHTAAASNSDIPACVLVCSQFIRHDRSHGELPWPYSSATDRQS